MRISSRRVISTGGIARERKPIRSEPGADSKVWMREESSDAFFVYTFLEGRNKEASD